ncbi:uncharacterized protein BYT42DRAFT_9579 [Radiomyces spectabilis]|uniref:uncharacterized protein n=1 Tax=Radiomyces spectabilis TaxID=64574 RepID=UPI00221F9EFF|nr:uncharacterized protein BYT42DRAFT_9579 [Radiomyces spectabilis]KAI8393514.1 hypothetical protein BYT42DRAFT_9579 [Radiomyces spectabilis]
MLEAELPAYTEQSPDTTEKPAEEAKDETKDSTFDPSRRAEALFLYGLDDMSTKDIHAYCEGLNLKKIEWINDSSCNLVFTVESDAKAAAQALLETPLPADADLSHKELQKAKPFQKDERQFNNLQLRVSTDYDLKEKGARERSRYYLLHGTEDSEVGERERESSSRGDIQSRLGPRRDDRRPRDRYQDRKSSGVFRRLGRHALEDDDDRDRRYSQRRGRSRHGSRRRSMSPLREISQHDEHDKDEEDKPVEIPDRLKGRLNFNKASDS